MEADECDAVGVQVGQAGLGLGGNLMISDLDDLLRRACHITSVNQDDIAVHLAVNRAAIRSEKAFHRVLGVHASAAGGCTDASQHLLVTDQHGGRAVEHRQEFVERIKGLEGRAVGIKIGPVGDLILAVLGRGTGERLIQAIEAVRVLGHVAIDNQVLELGSGGLDLLSHVQCDAAGSCRAEGSENAVNRERATHDAKRHGLVLGGHVLV